MSHKDDTLTVHAGRHPEHHFGAVNPPVYHVSTVTFPTVAALEAASHHPYDGMYYGRYGTPTTFALEEAVAALEGGSRTVATSSGLAAICATLVAFTQAGDHILVTDSAYAPTRKFCDGVLKRYGVETSYFDPAIGGDITSLMRPNTRLVFLESPGSLTFEVQDVPAIAAAARAHGAVVAIDNTWGTPLFFKPFDKGVDVSVQAATKYIVGHADAMLGTITTRDDDLWHQVKATVAAFGYNAGADECYLGLRGLRSLSARLERHQRSALDLAQWLETRDEVTQVLHPALPSHPGHALWKRDFLGSCGLFAVMLKPFAKPAVDALLDGMELFAMGFSWGGFESLILDTSRQVMRTAVPWSATGPLLRLHVGLEDVADLKADLEAGFERLRSV
jgi:cystathionine beta-lyase